MPVCIIQLQEILLPYGREIMQITFKICYDFSLLLRKAAETLAKDFATFHDVDKRMRVNVIEH